VDVTDDCSSPSVSCVCHPVRRINQMIPLTSDLDDEVDFGVWPGVTPRYTTTEPVSHFQTVLARVVRRMPRRESTP
jgi:hypothetical protein